MHGESKASRFCGVQLCNLLTNRLRCTARCTPTPRQVTGEEFPGAAGAEVLKTVLSSGGRRRRRRLMCDVIKQAAVWRGTCSMPLACPTLPPPPLPALVCPSTDAATKLQYGGRRAAEAAAALAASAPHAAAGGDDGGLPPLSRSCLTPRQQQAVAALLRVRALVARFVAKHDEDRTTVGVLQWHKGAPKAREAGVRCAGRNV